MTAMNEITYVDSDKNLSDLRLGGDYDSDPLESLEEFAGGDDFSLFDASSFGLSEGDFTLDFGDPESSALSPHDRFQESLESAQSNLPKFRGRGRQKTVERVNEEDFFEGAERNAYLLIKGYRDWLFDGKATPEELLQAVDFFFTMHDNDCITFKACCEVLRVRPDVVRMRMQYEWWLRGTRFTGPFDFFTVPVPDMIQGEIYYYGGDAGYALAREVWVQPGISEEELLEAVARLDGFTRTELSFALQALEEHFLLSKEWGWYLTGRNPMLMNTRASSIYGREHSVGGSFHWSRLFGQIFD